ncbi:MAG: ClpXP protease specificity-enhancing factor SspB [Pseudomonadota bacterium]
MAGNGLNYGHLMQKAMRGMMADVLGRIAEDGLPGDHHFYICFETYHPGVDIPDWLRETYPDEMTIVLQEWFRDLVVTQDRFSVTLNFSDQAQTLVIPFAAVRTFVDPSVKFGLKFDAYDADEREELDLPEPEDEPEPEIEEPAGTADVVSLDKFRKS